MSSLGGLRVGLFGRYDPNDARNQILQKCLRRAGAEVVSIDDSRSLARRTPALLRRALGTRLDLLIVGFRAHSDLPTAKLVSRMRRVPLIFDPLVSRYEERAVDRELVDRRSWLAGWYRLTDALGCRLADRILLETETQIAYFSDTFSVPRRRFRRVWLGADNDIMRPGSIPAADDPSRPFTVFFYGRFSPLHGVGTIIRAAALLEQRGRAIRFVLVGGGQTYHDVRTLADALSVTTIEFKPPVSYAELPGLMMSQADLCLGSFGTTDRAHRVVPHKVFDALAVGRPVVTADTRAIHEAVTPGEHLWVCEPGHAESLANAIVHLERNPGLRQSLAENGHRIFRERFSVDVLTQDIADIVGELVCPPGCMAS